MNTNATSSRAMTLGSFSQHQSLTKGYTATQQEALVLAAPKLSWVILVLSVLFSMLGTVYLKDYNRQLFINYQKLQQEYAALQVNAGKLTLTQNLAATHTYVQAAAENNLNMHLPEAKDVVLLN